MTEPSKVYYFLTKSEGESAIVFINREAVESDPIYTLITLAHELGHIVEDRRKIGTKITENSLGLQNGRIVDEVTPQTEVIACIYGAKMAKIIWDKTGDEASIAGGAKQVERYNHVTFGNPLGTN